MTKKTLFLSQSAHLSLKKNQLLVYLKKKKEQNQYPIEDLAIIVLEHQEITLTQQLLAHFGAQNVAVVFCDPSHLPNSMLRSFDAYYLSSARFRQQITASHPLIKQLWQKTIKHKIRQQAQLLTMIGSSGSDLLYHMAKNVRSGDSTHLEAQAARNYWTLLLGADFYRSRIGPSPNHLLNYGYAIVRAATARALVGNGLNNALGIHHHNQYNAFCLADDMMEPYRPFVDALVYDMEKQMPLDGTITSSEKAQLLGVLTMDCLWEGQCTTVGNAIQRTASSLATCFEEKTPHTLSFATHYVLSEL